jgi:hypothetical protein
LPPVILLPGHRPSQEAKCLSLAKRLMSVPVSLTTARAVVTSMPSMRVRSTPHIWKSWRRGSNLGALRHGILHHRSWNVAPDRARRLDHSLKLEKQLAA